MPKNCFSRHVVLISEIRDLEKAKNGRKWSNDYFCHFKSISMRILIRKSEKWSNLLGLVPNDYVGLLDDLKLKFTEPKIVISDHFRPFLALSRSLISDIRTTCLLKQFLGTKMNSFYHSVGLHC